MIKIHNVRQGSAEWFALREGKWTGSNIINMLKGRAWVQQQNFTSKYTERGKWFEQQALLAYYLATGKKYKIIGFVTNPDYPTCGYSPDGISGKTLLEVKCFTGDRHKMLVDENIPIEIMAQIQFGMMICELKKATLIAYNPNESSGFLLHMIDIPRDEQIIKNMQTKLKAPR